MKSENGNVKAESTSIVLSAFTSCNLFSLGIASSKLVLCARLPAALTALRALETWLRE